MAVRSEPPRPSVVRAPAGEPPLAVCLSRHFPVRAAAAGASQTYLILLVLQLLGYLGAAIALALPRLAARVPLLPTAGSFVVLNFAALLSLPAMLASDPARLWKKH